MPVQNALLRRSSPFSQGARSCHDFSANRFAVAQLCNGILLHISIGDRRSKVRFAESKLFDASGHLIWQQIFDLYDEHDLFECFAKSFGVEFTEEYIARFGQDQTLDLRRPPVFVRLMSKGPRCVVSQSFQMAPGTPRIFPLRLGKSKEQC